MEAGAALAVADEEQVEEGCGAADGDGEPCHFRGVEECSGAGGAHEEEDREAEYDERADCGSEGPGGEEAPSAEIGDSEDEAERDEPSGEAGDEGEEADDGGLQEDEAEVEAGQGPKLNDRGQERDDDRTEDDARDGVEESCPAGWTGSNRHGEDVNAIRG